MHFAKSSFIALLMGCTFVTALPAAVSTPPAVTATSLAHANLNTATVKALKVLPGLNANKARAIVAWRKQHGPFVSVEDLHKVTGFKRLDGQKWEEMKRNFTVS